MNLIWNFGNDDPEMEISMDYVGPESKMHAELESEMCAELEIEMHAQLENEMCVDYW